MIYMVHPTKHDDITPALRFGEPRYVNTGYLYPDEIEVEDLPPKVTQNMEACADAFRPEQDFLVILGDHLQLIAFSAMLAVRHPWFRVLRYDRIESAYWPIRVPGYSRPAAWVEGEPPRIPA